MSSGTAVSLPMVHHARSGQAFSHTVRIEPLCDTSGARQCYQVTSTDVELLPLADSSSAAEGAGPSHCAAAPRMPSPPLRATGMGMARIPSDFKINEMLDLFDASDSCVSPFPGTEGMTSSTCAPVSE